MMCPETQAVEKRKVAKVAEAEKRKVEDNAQGAAQSQGSRKAAKLVS